MKDPYTLTPECTYSPDLGRKGKPPKRISRRWLVNLETWYREENNLQNCLYLGTIVLPDTVVFSKRMAEFANKHGYTLVNNRDFKGGK